MDRNQLPVLWKMICDTHTNGILFLYISIQIFPKTNILNQYINFVAYFKYAISRFLTISLIFLLQIMVLGIH